MRRLTKAQKAKNKALYAYIRKQWEKANKIATIPIDYKTFKKISMGLAEKKGTSYRSEAKLYAHSKRFIEEEDLGKENILKGLKNEFRDTYDELRKRVGPMKKGETLKDQLEWDKDLKSYILTGYNGTQYIIDISNSPLQASLIQL